jgi:ABC-type sugar transport system ATPase subunit
LGEYSLAYVMLGDGSEITAKLGGDNKLGIGSEINLSAPTEKLHFFDSQNMVLN